MLAAIYFGGLLLLQQLLTAESPIAVVLSTLAIAGLFSPLRRRLQVAIDKRFYRQQYDAGQALAGFVEELRDDVELEQISAALLSVVDRTILPTHVSLWLRVGGEEQNSGSHRAGAAWRKPELAFSHLSSLGLSQAKTLASFLRQYRWRRRKW